MSFASDAGIVDSSSCGASLGLGLGAFLGVVIEPASYKPCMAVWSSHDEEPTLHVLANVYVHCYIELY